MAEIISLWASLLLQAGHLWMKSVHVECGLSHSADEAQFVLQHKCFYSCFRKGVRQSTEWRIMICKATWGSDFIPMNIRVLYWPQWKGIQVLNGFITSLIIADEMQNKTQFLIPSLQGNVTLSSPQKPACNRKAAIRRKAISGQTWKSHMWELTTVLENRPGKAGVLDTLNHKSSSSSRAVPSLPALSLRWDLCSAFTGARLLVCCVHLVWQMHVLWLWRPLHLDHSAVAFSIMLHHPCCSCTEKRVPQTIYNVFQLLVIPEDRCKWEELSSLGSTEHSD